MEVSAFERGEQMNNRKIEYTLYPPNWDEYGLVNNLNITNWTTIKYLNDDKTAFNTNVDLLPNDTGGLYLFTIKCPLIIGCTEYPVYIGRAQYTNNQNLRKRCREYFSKFLRNDERPLITKMIQYWGEHLYLSFLPLTTNTSIIDDEAALINALLLPFNTQIPSREIRQAVKAFG